ncbi:permease prefix domain 1-containing protein [Salibacterium lacus]|uniref:Permease prefix domain 1-containing protein n=1 Tax=Salibacterium lacus TaxID=1898109 RepID=A0ABW5T4E4_9BACI
MRQVDTYVEQVFQERNKDKQEIKELQNEMKNHLYESAADIKRKGFSQEEAEEIAIQRFGGETIIPRILDQVSKQQKSFADKLLYAGIIMLCLSLAAGLGLHYFSVHMVTEQSRIADSALDILGEQEEISGGMEQQIQQEIDSPYLEELSVYRINEEPIDDVVSKRVVETEPRFAFNQSPSIIGSIFLTGGKTEHRTPSWKIESHINNFYTLSDYIIYTGLLLYWVLFSIWGTIRAHHKNLSPWRWGIIFLLSNVVGLLIMQWFQRSVRKKSS